MPAFNQENGGAAGGERPRNPAPTPRTYIADSWKQPELRREILNYLAAEYDWYIDRMIGSILHERNRDADIETDSCVEAVKERFFVPDDETLAGGKFWVECWDRRRGPLRNYFRTCIRNFVRNWLKTHKESRYIAFANDDGEQSVKGVAEPASPDPTPAEQAAQNEFDSRYDKMLFLRRAMDALRNECGADSDRWRVYEMYTSSWPLPAMTEIALSLRMSPAAVNNHIHRSRKRIQELLWWLVRSLEMDDQHADEAVLELVGRLPDCRRRKQLPAPSENF